MANRLKMATVQAILQLKEHGWSNRRIERELGVRRETISRYVQGARTISKAAKAPPGSEQAQPFSGRRLFQSWCCRKRESSCICPYWRHC